MSTGVTFLALFALDALSAGVTFFTLFAKGGNARLRPGQTVIRGYLPLPTRRVDHHPGADTILAGIALVAFFTRRTGFAPGTGRLHTGGNPIFSLIGGNLPLIGGSVDPHLWGNAIGAVLSPHILKGEFGAVGQLHGHSGIHQPNNPDAVAGCAGVAFFTLCTLGAGVAFFALFALDALGTGIAFFALFALCTFGAGVTFFALFTLDALGTGVTLFALFALDTLGAGVAFFALFALDALSSGVAFLTFFTLDALGAGVAFLTFFTLDALGAGDPSHIHHPVIGKTQHQLPGIGHIHAGHADAVQSIFSVFPIGAIFSVRTVPAIGTILPVFTHGVPQVKGRAVR